MIFRNKAFFLIFIFTLSVAVAGADAQVPRSDSLRYFDVSNS